MQKTVLFAVCVGTIAGAASARAQEYAPPAPTYPSGPEGTVQPEGTIPSEPEVPAAPDVKMDEHPGVPPAYPTGEPTTKAPAPPAVYPPGSTATTVVVGPGQKLEVTPIDKEKKDKPKFSPQNWTIAGGGGVGAFARGRTNDNTSLGGVWDARVHLGTRSIASFEAQYLGSIQDASTPFVTSVSTHQATGSFRLNMTKWRIQPFLAGGAGWVRLKAHGTVDAPAGAVGFSATQNAAAFPMGGGLTTYLGKHALLEARAAYAVVVGAKDFTLDNNRPDTWNVHFNAGYAF